MPVTESDSPAEGPHPVAVQEFEALMDRFAPFECRPVLGVGVSGGADSMALALLAHEWAQQRGGRAWALIVDHGLRGNAAQEAAWTAQTCADWGMKTRILRWQGEKPVTGIEEAARLARRHLLTEACRSQGILHLLLAHHGNDQDETVAMRRTMRSGSLGLAGMSACIEQAELRLLRPLLGLPKLRLEATLRERGIGWAEDPMNRDLSFARARLRREGAPASDPALAGERRDREQELATVLPGLVTITARGVARLDRAGFARLNPAQRHLLVSRLARTIGGLDYPPRVRRVEALVSRLVSDDVVRASLGRCLWRGEHAITVMRELRGLPFEPVQGGPLEVLWDGRFRLLLPPGRWTVGPLNLTQWRDLAGHWEQSGTDAPTKAEFGGLPAVYDLEGVAAVPHLGYACSARLKMCRARFAPRQPLVPAYFAGTGATDPERR